MALKTINSKILLRYDQYSAWTTKNPVLLAGEVAVAVAPADAGTGLHEPCVTMKVGDGTSTYNDLSFITALSGDVLTACKTEKGLTDYIKKVLVDAGVLNDGTGGDGDKSLAERVTDAEGDIKNLQAADEALRAEIAAKIASTYKASGSVASADGLPTADATTLGNVYNVTADFTTTTNFIEGAGKVVPAGSNVVIVETKPAEGNGFNGTMTSAYNVADITGDYVLYLNSEKISNVFPSSVLKESTVESIVGMLNASPSVLDSKGRECKPFTYDTATGKIFDKDGNFVTFASRELTNFNVITFKEPTPAEYAYDVVGSFIDMSNYMTKAETEQAIADAKDEVIAKIPEEVEKALNPVPNPDDPNAEPTKPTLLVKVEEIVTTAIEGLDYADTAVAGQFVTSVSEVDGVISVVRKAIETGDIAGLEKEIQTVIKESLTKPADPVDPNNPTDEETAKKELYDAIMSEVTKLINDALSGGADGSDGVDGLIATIETIVKDAILDAGDSTVDPARPASELNQAVNGLITAKIEGLDYTDDGTTGVVTKVEQTDGVIAVTKTAIKEVEGFNDAVADAVTEIVTPPAEGETPSESYIKLVESITNTITNEINKEGTEADPNELADAIKNAIDEALKQVGTPGDGENPEVPPSVLNTTVNNMIDSKVNALDVEDTAVADQFVTSVSQVDGKVVVTRAAIHFDQIVQEETDNDIIIGGGGA